MLHRISLLTMLACAGVCPALRAQSVNEVRVYSDEPGARFRVDGQAYIGVAVFLWPEGSKHLVEALQPTDEQWGLKYEYRGWDNNLGDRDNGEKKPITAGAGLKWVRLHFTLSYLVTVSVTPDCPVLQTCPALGQVVTGSGPVVNTTYRDYVERGTVATFTAYPGPGAIFVDWMAPQELSPQSKSSYIIHVPINGPTSVVARFMPAAAATTSVAVATAPPGLTVIVDSARFTQGVAFEWGWNTVHHIAVDPNQTSGSVPYVFQSWSDGGDFSHDVTVPSPSTPITLTATFVPAHTVQFFTSPANLKLTVDGRQDWANYAFAWLPGSVHRVSAPATQTDAQGRRYRFGSWSNGQTASFDYTAGPPAGDLRVIATYQLLGQATITTSPANLSVDVDGAPCPTPCVVQRDAGETIRVTAAPVLNNSERSRLVFRGWTDGGSGARAIQLSADPKTYTAAYTSQSRLSISAVPSNGAAIVLDPPSPDAFYDAGAAVSVAATPALGFRIRTWSGDLSGAATNASIVLDAPKDVVLLLDRVAAIAPSGVRSAAVGAGAEDVAPGSLISIFGANFASATAIGPTNPLAQTLQGVVVRVDDAILPLVYVSPEQINAQLPAGTPLGTRLLTVSSSGNPDVSRTIRVVRNSPGVFSDGANDQPVGLFLREDGAPVTTDHPARPGDVVAMLGTGLGPYAAEPPDGFVLDEASGYSVADKVQVIVDGSPIDALFAGRSSAGVGVDAVRFRVPADIAVSRALPVKITVAGRESNTVWLPVVR